MHATDNTNPDCPSTQRHGTGVAYRIDRCRCDAARAANTRTSTTWRLNDLHGIRQKTPATGTRRRLQALAAIGWPKTVIAPRLGVAPPRLDVILRQANVHRSTAARVAAVYEALADTPGPSRYTAGQARRCGFVPPIGWDDDTIDNPDAQPWAVLCDDGRVRHGQQLARPAARPQAHTPAQRAIRDERRNARKVATRARAAADLEARVDAYIGAGS